MTKKEKSLKDDGYEQLTFKKRHGFNTYMCRDCGAHADTKEKINHFETCVREVKYGAN
jgi:uncharacterized protein YlaI